MGDKSGQYLKTFTRNDCIQYVAKLLGSSRTSFGPSQLNFALAVAEEAEMLYLSRFRAPKQALPEPYRLEAELIWMIGMLSIAQLFNAATFEDIMAKTNAEVAGYICIVNPDTRLPLFERTKKFLIALAAGTNTAKLIGLARQLAAIKIIGDDSAVVENQNILFELAECLKHLHQVTRWSQKTLSEWQQCKNIVNSWGMQGHVPWTTSRPFLHWSLDFTKEHNDLKQLFEID